jgi:hypothetical protein
MIQDPIIKNEIIEEWDGVRSFQSSLQAHLWASGGISSVGATHQLRNISHNLTILFAFSVFERALKQLRDENVFQERNNGLKKLMDSSKNQLPWQDFDLIDKARDDRNMIAHQKKILERGDCWKYIDGIENELVSWGIITNPQIFNH